MGLIHKSVPVSSTLLVKKNERTKYFDAMALMPASLQKMLYEPNVGSFIRGLAKTHQLQPDQAPKIAFAVLRVAVGEIELAKLGSVLSSELKLANGKAQKIAAEIEKDLFAPVSLELTKYLESKKQQQEDVKNKKTAGLPPEALAKGGASNVLNLKEQDNPPKPPPIPRARGMTTDS